MAAFPKAELHRSVVNPFIAPALADNETQISPSKNI